MSVVKAVVGFESEESKENKESTESKGLIPSALTVHQALAEQDAANETSDALAQLSESLDREGSCLDIFQTLRIRERSCSDMTVLNEYVTAYFANVHPLLPVLHKEAFLRLYRLYGLKSLADNIRTVSDASSHDGRAVGLICSVLALGSLSLVETRNGLQDGENDESVSDIPHFGEALGFYGSCLRLMAYTHDTVETMITYLLMVLHYCISKVC
jgi:hypothetical protein